MQASARAARGPCVGVKRMVYLMLASDPTDASGCRSGKWILIDWLRWTPVPSAEAAYVGWLRLATA